MVAVVSKSVLTQWSPDHPDLDGSKRSNVSLFSRYSAWKHIYNTFSLIDLCRVRIGGLFTFREGIIFINVS